MDIDMVLQPGGGRRRDTEEPGPSFSLGFQVFSDGFEEEGWEEGYPGHSSARTPGSSWSSSSPSATATSPPSLSSFHLFPSLPAELRLKIWEHLIRPRIVMVVCADEASGPPSRSPRLARRPSRPRTPALLHCCRESRAVGLRHYEQAFSWRTPASMLSPDRGRGGRQQRGVEGEGEVAGRSRIHPPAVYFNFDMDALYLLGELEPLDAYGFGTPMAYFLGRADTRRVRHVACAFEELGFVADGRWAGALPGEAERAFGCLFHIVDRFSGADRLIVAFSGPGGGGGAGQSAEGGGSMVGPHPPPSVPAVAVSLTENPVQKLWRGWLKGTSVVSSTLAQKQIIMVREDGLREFIGVHL